MLPSSSDVCLVDPAHPTAVLQRAVLVPPAAARVHLHHLAVNTDGGPIGADNHLATDVEQGTL